MRRTPGLYLARGGGGSRQDAMNVAQVNRWQRYEIKACGVAAVSNI